MGKLTTLLLGSQLGSESGGGVIGEEITVTATQQTQVITPSEGKNAITKVTVNPLGKFKPKWISFYDSIVDDSDEFNEYLNQFDTSEMTEFRYTFSQLDDSNNQSTIKLIVPFDTSNVLKFVNTFSASRFLELDISRLDFRKATQLYEFVYSDGGMTKLILPTEVQNLSSLTTIYQGFASNTSLGDINLDFLGISNSQLVNTERMFDSCRALKTVKMRNFYGKSNSTGRMFNECNNLESIEIDNMDFSNNPYGRYMFDNCGSSLPSGTYTKVYVKDQTAQNYVINNGMSGWSTANVIIAGSADDHRTD